MALTGALFLMAYALARRGALLLGGGGAGAFVLAGYGVAFLLIPSRLLDTAYVDLRILVVAAMVVPAFVTVRLPEPRARLMAGGALCALILVNLGMVAIAQADYRRAYREIVASFAAVQKGARILVAASDDGVEPPRNLLDYPMMHAPVLAVHYADAFVPTLFTFHGKTPVMPRDTVRPLALMQGSPEPVALLREIARGSATTAPRYIATWARDFDYLYVVGRPIDNPLPEVLEQFARGTRFTAYRVRR
jgi:hypothetical protein